MRRLRLSPRALRIALLASLALNLAVAGLLVGWALGPRGPDRDGAHLPRLMRALPKTERHVLHERLRPSHERRGAHEAAMAALAGAVAAEPFDRAALDAALTALRTDNARMAQRLDAGFADMVAGMDGMARAELAKRLAWRR